MSSLTDLISQMQIFSASDSHSQVLQAGRKVLIQDAHNLGALKQCLVALINMDKYEAALKMMDEYKELLKTDDSSDKLLLLEKAYIYYKTNNGAKLESLIPLAKGIRGFQHILAQYYYRIGRNEDALKLYQILLQHPGAEESDLSVNETAILSQIKHEDSSVSIPLMSRNAFGSYDLISNKALIKLFEHNYSESLQLLEKALKMAEETLKNYDSDSRAAELIPIHVQIAYVNQLLGNADKAEQILAQFDVTTVKDQVLKLIITNNLISLKDSDRCNNNPALLYREMDLPSSLHNSLDRLTLPQTKILQRNELLLAQRAGKNLTDVAKRNAEKFPGSDMGLALSTMEKTGIEFEDLDFENNVKKLFRYSIKHPEDLPFALLVCQISIAYGNLQNAAILLENIVQHDEQVLFNKPAVASLLYYIYEKSDKKKSIIQLLNRLYDGLSMKKISNSEEYKLLKFSAFQLLSIDAEKSKQLFAKIEGIEKEQVQKSALVEAILGGSAEHLPSVESLVAEINTDSLIEQGMEPLMTKNVKGENTKPHSKVIKLKKTKRERNKPKKLPKNLSKKIDEERWLPMKDRSYYKSKKSKHNKTQGGIADESLDINEKVIEKPQNGKKRKIKKKKGGK
ncbi:hypothetical protein FOA43_002013 [Brettanomyces nanus]|uniref:Signal recognition particle subunit SRP72 n=1 Tax=Eeniella nana TaxID=13502 RepID=A0A875RP74_EENNA|nr:uncharacterized protein FOA43_002013 [Brettanomyces nanus]QPG74680.1 hypothetical protein FOA43_002013 [Brettanomyces nanus]